MVFDNSQLSITKEDILKKVSEEDIFKKYLGLEPVDRGSFTNPLRKGDDDPGCSFYVDARGKWIFKDFAGGFHWDCFNVVEYYFNCSFKEALIKIGIDFNILDGSKTDIQFYKRTPTKRNIQLRIKRRAWTKQDYAFWLEYGIKEETLYRGNVYPISHAWFFENGPLRPAYYYTPNDLAFAYHFGDYNYKIYMPFRPKGKKFLQTSTTFIQGINILPETGTNLLITKSYKDVLTLFEYAHRFDLHSVAPMSETVVITIEQFSDLYNRFDNIATLFDFDKAGISLMRKYESLFKLPYYMFGMQYKKEGIKDFADHRKIKGDYETSKLIENYLKPLY